MSVHIARTRLPHLLRVAFVESLIILDVVGGELCYYLMFKNHYMWLGWALLLPYV